MKNILKYSILVLITLKCLLLSAQDDKKINLVIGGNLNNPHKLMEEANSHTDIYGKNAFGNMYLGLLFKKKIQINLSSELNEFNGLNYINNDYLLNVRYYILKPYILFKPYMEIGTIISSLGYGTSNINSQQSLNTEIGFIYKINPIVNLSFSCNYLFRQFEIVRDNSTYYETVELDRTMIKTGIQFNIN